MAEPWTTNEVLNTTGLAGLPWGVMAYVNGSASAQTGITTATDLTSLSVTWTAVSTRLYKVELWVQAQQITSTGTAEVLIADGANTAMSWPKLSGLVANQTAFFYAVELVTGLSGSTTRKGRALTSAGTLTINPDSFTSRRPRLIVTDVGAA